MSFLRSSGVGKLFGVISSAGLGRDTVDRVKGGELVGDIPEVCRSTEVYRVRIAFVLFLEKRCECAS